jgi:hypothetical protein
MKRFWWIFLLSVVSYGQPVKSGVPVASTGNLIKGTSGNRATGIPIATGTTSNTDLAGILTLSGGTATYTFTATYVSPPFCVANDTTATNAVKASATTTVLTLTGTSADVVNYICVQRRGQ